MVVNALCSPLRSRTLSNRLPVIAVQRLDTASDQLSAIYLEILGQIPLPSVSDSYSNGPPSTLPTAFYEHESRRQVSSRSESVSRCLPCWLRTVEYGLTCVLTLELSSSKTSGQSSVFITNHYCGYHVGVEQSITELTSAMQLQCYTRRAFRPVREVRTCPVR